MRLERKWARVVIVLWGAACVPILLLTLAGLLGLRGGSIWLAVAALTVSIICVAAGLILIFHKLLCPSCKKNMAPLHWNSHRWFYCKYCGKPFLFDDDPPDPSTTTETREEP